MDTNHTAPAPTSPTPAASAHEYMVLLLDSSTVLFIGSYPECCDWVNEQVVDKHGTNCDNPRSFGYDIHPITYATHTDRFVDALKNPPTPDPAIISDDAVYAVWYASVGCLPDSDTSEPAYVGTLESCEEFVAEQRELDPDFPDTADSLYSYSIESYDESVAELAAGLPYTNDASPATATYHLTGAITWSDNVDTIVNLTVGRLIELATCHPEHPVRHYYSDFAHDMRWLMQHLQPNLTFGFSFDDCGTWIYPHDQVEFDSARKVAYRCTLRPYFGSQLAVVARTDAEFEARRDFAIRNTPATWYLDVTEVAK